MKKETTLESGIVVVEEQEGIEKREKMTLREWRTYYAYKEFTEEEFLDMCSKYRRPLDA